MLTHISQFLVGEKPYGINPGHDYCDTNLRKLEQPTWNILHDLISLISVFRELGSYYSNLMKLMKLHHYLKKLSDEYLDVRLLAFNYGINVPVNPPFPGRFYADISV